MTLLLLILFGLSFAANVVAGYIIVHGGQRLLQFDDMYELLVDDIDTNIKYFDKLLATPLFSNEPQIVEAQRNMLFIRERLNEYVLRMEEATGRPMRRREAPPGPPPAFRD